MITFPELELSEENQDRLFSFTNVELRMLGNHLGKHAQGELGSINMKVKKRLWLTL